MNGVARTDIVRLRPGPCEETIKTRAAIYVTRQLDAEIWQAPNFPFEICIPHA